MNSKTVAPDRIIRVGDVLVNSTGVGTLGRVAQVRLEPPEPTTVDTHVTIVRPQSERFYPEFFGYMLILIEDEISKSGAGASGQTELARSTLQNNFTVSFPTSLDDQKRIVAILDEAFAGLTTATANAEKNLKNARELFDSYINSVFARDWPQAPLGNVSENLDSRRVPITKKFRKPGPFPYYGASGAVDFVDDFIFDEDLLLVSEDGANLVMRTYPIAFSISGKAWVNNHAHVLRFSTLASQKWIEYYLNSISLMPYVSGMAQPKLNQRALNSIPVPFPSLEEQEREVDGFGELFSQVNRLKEVYQDRMASIGELKQSVLEKAFSGELTSPPSSAIKEAAE